jgi:UPF0271 protein
MAVEGKVAANDGGDVDLQVETICTHGDTPGAQDLTRAIREGLERAGIRIAPLSRPPR